MEPSTDKSCNISSVAEPSCHLAGPSRRRTRMPPSSPPSSPLPLFHTPSPTSLLVSPLRVPPCTFGGGDRMLRVPRRPNKFAFYSNCLLADSCYQWQLANCFRPFLSACLFVCLSVYFYLTDLAHFCQCM